ncbi:epoxyqueuosine reductase QueH [Helicobacter anatolicus]|uniref:epoxyqueuosine reductase QueH n=1 Tax=Helicobacter anatolicus TaxID=2905874 RepID=UPI001E43C3C0|nr:epoxyqueuosine reductase QueH [Helicobacter anatolicus]MCE3040107.1 epoxyqueuosine reductase QueH [Helicobacter anatolicus]
MLVHICCSVDSHYFLSELQKAYPDEKLIGFFYNPNIHPKSEHDLRLADVQRSCDMLGIELLCGEWDVDSWLDGVKGLEEEPEKGERCVKCFDIRLARSAVESKKIGEKRFTTTLLSSPMKEQERLFIEGDNIASAYDLDFVKINVRANGGVQKQNELAKKDNLYRQNYCGCKFALSKQREKQNKTSLEMLSDLFNPKPLGSIEERQEVFAKRDNLEKTHSPYLLIQRKYQVFRILSSSLMDFTDCALPHYVLANSQSKKKTKIPKILWVKPKISLPEHLQKKYQSGDYQIGYSSKDDSMFVPLEFINFIFATQFQNILDLKSNSWNLEKEMELRITLCGHQSLNAIFVVSKKIDENLIVEVQSIFQEENIFRVVEFL